MLYNPEIYWLAYRNIYSNKGAMTPGTDGTSINGMSQERIDSIIEKMRNGTYHPQPARRTYIPKKNSDKLRPLGIQSGDDKLVEEAVKMILEAIYEPTFSDKSHGFRPGRSCHTALKQIQTTFKSTVWFIEGDIKSCFDSFDHQVMIKILRRRIKDEKFIQLIWKMLKAGYMEQWSFQQTNSGVPQGSGSSPILCNIYLNELDTFVTNLAKEYGTEGQRKRNKGYAALTYEMSRYKAEGDKIWNELTKEEKRVRRYHLKQLEMERRAIPATNADEKYVRIQYARYADDFLCGVIGSKKDAEVIKEKIKEFLQDELHLTMSEEKTKITHTSQRARFLGYDIIVSRDNSVSRVYGTKRKRKDAEEEKGRQGAPKLRKNQIGMVKLLIPREKWVNKLLEYSAIRIKKDGNGKETFKVLDRGYLCHLPDKNILDLYNAEIRGLYNYYCIANNVTILGKFVSIMKYSFLKTLAGKYRTTSRKIRSRYTACGILGVHYETKSGTKFEGFYDVPTKRQLSAPQGPDLGMKRELGRWRKPNSLKGRVTLGRCELCGTETKQLIIHQVKKLKDLTGLEDWERKMIKMRRKTLVVCRQCFDGIQARCLSNASGEPYTSRGVRTVRKGA